jgi:uncharacterized membrane protein
MAREAPNSGNGAMDRLKAEARSLAGALGDRAMASVRDRVEGATGRLTEYVEGGGGPGIMAALTGARNLAEGKSPARSMFGAGFAGLKEKVTGLFSRGGKGGGSRKLKLTNIVESIDVGVPRTVAYNQWTQYSDFPKFTKKVENVDQNKNEENKTNWKAQVFWSHRTWEATVIEQVPDERIIWRSKGQKGHVDGAVTFHELTPNLTRILVVLEYHPQGMFERTGNLWRAQGRRARLELKHFRRHMTPWTGKSRKARGGTSPGGHGNPGTAGPTANPGTRALKMRPGTRPASARKRPRKAQTRARTPATAGRLRPRAGQGPRTGPAARPGRGHRPPEIRITGDASERAPGTQRGDST